MKCRLKVKFFARNCAKSRSKVRENKEQIRRISFALLLHNTVRSIQQDKARTSLLERLDKTSVLITQDWGLKFLLHKFRETQAYWFANRGTSWHISVVVRKLAEKLQQQAFVHIVENYSQDSDVVVSIIRHTLQGLERTSRNFNCLSPTGQCGVLPQCHHVSHLSTYGTSDWY